MAQTLVEHVVADAGAFLKKASLQDIGRNIYTLRDVVEEIRDRATRRSLAFLPYQLHFREPRPEHIRLVTEFSKKTGDYPSLSATDIKVLALTYQLELEHVGAQNLRTEPQLKVDVRSTQRHPETPLNVAGFHFPSKKPAEGSGGRPSSRVAEAAAVAEPAAPPASGGDQFNSFQFWRQPLVSIEEDLLGLLEDSGSSGDKAPATAPALAPPPSSGSSSSSSVVAPADQFNSFLYWREPPPHFSDDLLELLEVGKGSSVSERGAGHSAHQSDDEDKENEPELEDHEEEEEDEDEDDGGGWITPSNIRQVKMESADWTAPADVTVGCLTTDFAMQNVLIQMGLHVLSVNGMQIREARNYILRCHACFKTTSNMSKQFCPHCGNQTLKKLAVTLSHDGHIMMHFSKNPKVLNSRGLRHSLPQPRGGKHSNNPHMVEDQRFPQQRASKKARQKTAAFDADYEAHASPFATNDVYSRAANLHIRDGAGGGGRRRANPNAARKKFVKK